MQFKRVVRPLNGILETSNLIKRVCIMYYPIILPFCFYKKQTGVGGGHLFSNFCPVNHAIPCLLVVIDFGQTKVSVWKFRPLLECAQISIQRFVETSQVSQRTP